MLRPPLGRKSSNARHTRRHRDAKGKSQHPLRNARVQHDRIRHSTGQPPSPPRPRGGQRHHLGDRTLRGPALSHTSVLTDPWLRGSRPDPRRGLEGLVTTLTASTLRPLIGGSSSTPMWDILRPTAGAGRPLHIPLRSNLLRGSTKDPSPNIWGSTFSS